MTPRRRAALRRAQLISAQKRRKGSRFGKVRAVGRGVGTAGAVVGSTFVAYHTQRYIARPDVLVRHSRKAGGSVNSGIRKAVRKVKPAKPRVIPKVDYSKRGYL